jgi:hypothetical protein
MRLIEFYELIRVNCGQELATRTANIGKVFGYSPATPIYIPLNNFFSKLLRRDF